GDLRGLTAQIPRAALENLRAGTGAPTANDDLRSDRLPLALRGAEPDLQESRSGRDGVVPVQPVPLPLHFMDEQVHVSVVVEIGSHHGAPVELRIGTAHVREVHEAVLSRVPPQVIALMSGEGAAIVEDETIVPALVGRRGDRLASAQRRLQFGLYRGGDDVPPVEALCVPALPARDVAVGAENVES